jgi:hypothetical protein
MQIDIDKEYLLDLLAHARASFIAMNGSNDPMSVQIQDALDREIYYNPGIWSQLPDGRLTATIGYHILYVEPKEDSTFNWYVAFRYSPSKKPPDWGHGNARSLELAKKYAILAVRD